MTSRPTPRTLVSALEVGDVVLLREQYTTHDYAATVIEPPRPTAEGRVRLKLKLGLITWTTSKLATARLRVVKLSDDAGQCARE